ncbi:P-loop containing nucleoside triphosphate hydrolase protein [Serendipita vermifera]|nr:P-loop containing nucleoside triphosphate hydrolase protein [Serendipita vermifera]
MSTNPEAFVIVVIGYTGSGKTTFIKALTGREDLRTHPTDPCTDRIEAYEMDLDGVRFKIVDTPGFRDEPAYDRSLSQQLRDFCRKQRQWPAFIYCHDIQGARIERTKNNCFEAAKRIFDQKDENGMALHPANVAIVTTLWSEKGTKPYDQQKGRQAQLESGFKEEWIKKGRLLHKTDDAPETNKEIIRSLRGNEVAIRKSYSSKPKARGIMSLFRKST